MIMSEADRSMWWLDCYDDQNGPHFEWRNSYFDPRVIHLKLRITELQFVQSLYPSDLAAMQNVLPNAVAVPTDVDVREVTLRVLKRKLHERMFPLDSKLSMRS
jgi:hypothetical protein